MSIIKLIYSAFLFSILLLATSINLQADPKRLFGDNGADLWMMSELDYAGIFPIRNGEALLVIWSENSADNNAECHCMQILSSNGSAEFVYPVQLSSTSSMVSNIKTASDLQGNIFAAWYEQKNEEDTTEYLYTQKFSPLGEPLWNQEPVRSKSKMVNFNGEIQIKGIDEVIPDKNGGCYVKRKYSDLIAFDENGTHRSNWKPENILRYPWSVIDENGGFWFISLSRKRGENTTYFVKRVNYYGKTLWEDSTKFGANVPERDMNAWNNENIIAHENDLILINEVGRERVKMKIP
ncbi:hypothetical protein K9N50_13395, partial [bacterium]|nr:hypothetical protein [bacterium]